MWPCIWWVLRRGSVRRGIGVYRLERDRASSGLAPDRQSQSLSDFALGARASFGSHLLGGLVQRICADWPQQHGWELELLETFVETGRFRGVAYRAANWQEVGQTTGRTRQEKQHRAQAPRKSVWVHPLGQRFREHLGALGSGGGAS